jgi:lysophospholipase L1-like esterase
MKFLRFLFLLSLLAATLFAQNSATTPASRTSPANWVSRHEGFLAEAKQGGFDLVFLGDSITDGWRTKGTNVWAKSYAPRRALNLGIGGDRTEHVLWRIANGELDNVKPKALVLMIGTNNTGKQKDGSPRNTTPEIIQGVAAVVKAVQAKLPKTKILLLAIFPRGEKDAPQRAQIAEINTAIARLDDGKKVIYLDIGQKFLEPDGTLPREIMPDLLHPNEKGYQIWADAIEPTLATLMK